MHGSDFQTNAKHGYCRVVITRKLSARPMKCSDFERALVMPNLESSRHHQCWVVISRELESLTMQSSDFQRAPGMVNAG